MSASKEVTIRSDGNLDTWLELDGKRLPLLLKSVRFEHEAGADGPIATVEVFAKAEAVVTLDRTTLEALRELTDGGAAVRE